MFHRRVEKYIAGRGGYDTLGGSAPPVAAKLQAVYKAARSSTWNRLCCPRLIWSHRETEMRTQLSYALWRDRCRRSPADLPLVSR